MTTQPAEQQPVLEKLEKEISSIKFMLEQILSLQQQLIEKARIKGGKGIQSCLPMAGHQHTFEAPRPLEEDDAGTCEAR